MKPFRGAPLLALVLPLALLPAAAPPAVAVPTAVTADQAGVACKRPARGFVPSHARIPAIGRTVRVIQVERTRDNAVGAGPVTEGGKWLMAMDPHTKPASRRGTVILSGHTWPDGSALGNAMLRDLQRGHKVTMLGKDGRQACYRIKERSQYPADRVPRKKAFRYWGPEQMVIVTCSGKRRGPGDWSHRTIWYAVPLLPPPPPPAPAPDPPEDEDSGGSLLGGLLGGLLG